MPSVLIETEFLSNTASEKFANSEKGQDYIARSIFSAFRQYKDEVEGKLAKYEDDIENTIPFIPEKDTTKKVNNKQSPIDKEEKNSVKDTVHIKKEPIIENDNESEIISKDSAKNILMPLLKIDSVKTIQQKDTVLVKNENIIYKVQFMSASQRVPMVSDKFKGLKDVGEYQDGAAYKYTAGEFKTIDEALKYRAEMQTKGYKDCFVVKFKDGKRMK